MKAIINHRNLKAAVYERIKESIIRGQLPPGAKLGEMQLAEKLGVSRTPLREAINSLEKDGFVDIFPRRGAYVKRHSLQEIQESLELREAMEGLAVRLAARHATPKIIQEMRNCFRGFTRKTVENSLPSYAQQNVRFHSLIFQASHNQKLITIIRNLFDQMDMVRLHTIVLPGRARKSLMDHHRIIQLIEKRLGREAEKLLRTHIRSLHKAVLKVPKFRAS